MTLAQKVKEKRELVKIPSQKEVPGLVENI
jgi:hypothetical protein